MTKYSRHSPIISKESDSQYDEDHWLYRFEKQLEKGAVQSRQMDKSLYDQMNSIMGNKSKHSSVEAVVKDMQERSGLTAYLNVKSDKDSGKKKVASDSPDENDAIDKKIKLIPIVIQKKPSIQNTLENIIRDSKGNLSIPAILDKIKSIHNKDVSESKDWDDDKLLKLVSHLNLSEKTKNPLNFEDYDNLGKSDNCNNQEYDQSNNDSFFSLKPAKF